MFQVRKFSGSPERAATVQETEAEDVISHTLHQRPQRFNRKLQLREIGVKLHRIEKVCALEQATLHAARQIVTSLLMVCHKPPSLQHSSATIMSHRS